MLSGTVMDSETAALNFQGKLKLPKQSEHNSRGQTDLDGVSIYLVALLCSGWMNSTSLYDLDECDTTILLKLSSFVQCLEGTCSY